MPAAVWALLLIPSVQAPLARWTPELAFSAKRVGGVAISPDGRWAAVEMSEPVMEPEVSEWRSSIRVYPVARMGLGTARVEPAASAPAWSPNGHWLAFVSTRSGTRSLWRAADRKSTRLNSSHITISYAVFCLKKKKNTTYPATSLHT